MTEYLPVHSPGEAVTYTAGSTITGGQVLIVNPDSTVSPTSSLIPSPKTVGVAGFDAATGDPVTVYAGGVQHPVAAATITAGQQVQSSTGGTVVAHDGASNLTRLGLALTTAAAGTRVRVRFNQ